MSKLHLFHLRDRIVLLSVLVFCVFYVNHAVAYHFVSKTLSNNTSSIKDTLPVKGSESLRIHKIENDKEIFMSYENGQLVELHINGENIPEEDYNKYQDIIDEAKPQTQPFNKNPSPYFGEKGEYPEGFISFNWDNLDSLLEGWSQSGIQMLQKFDNWEGFENFDSNLIGDPFQTLKDLLESEDFKNFSIDTSFNFQFKNFDNIPPWDLEDNDSFTNGVENNNFTDILGNALNRDELLIPNKINNIELTGKHLKINGEKQPNNIWSKYKRIFEESSGTPLQRNSKIIFDYEGSVPKRKFRSF